MKKQEIKVAIEFTEGYEKRYTEACLKQLRKRKKQEASKNETEQKTA